MKLFLYVLLSLLVTIRANGCFEVERDALLTFKAGLHDPGNLMSSWQGPNCCNWSGITCHAKTHHVVKLNLRTASNWVSHALSGELDPALVSLRHLTHLDLSNNDFSNLSIPKFIGSLQNLVYLNLSNSWFLGAMPYELGNLSRLQYLDLSNSQFTGTIPPQLGNISDLQYLNLYYSYKIPMPAINSLSWLYHLSNLTYIDMSGYDINQVDWSEISKMHQLNTLSLSRCYLSNIPIDLFHVNFSSLTKLDLSYNSFSATLPNWFWNLTGLLYLDISNSKFHGTIPSALTNLASLNYLAFGGNNFKNIDFNQIGKLHNLISLDLSSSGVGGDFLNLNNADLKPLSKLNNLRTIDLSSLGLGGDVLDLIKRLGNKWYNLEDVNLSDNHLSGNISTSWITNMRNLSNIDLRHNLLTGHITSDIGILTQLKELFLSDNSLSGVITEAHFVNLSNLEYLDLSNNMLTIKINEKWVSPFQLLYLNMESCKVGPRFPNWLRGQTQLYYVWLSNTSIVGAIPTWFWDIPLGVVAFSFNNITGSLPTSFQLSSLWGLYLNSNSISGIIPSIWGVLGELDLSENQIYGSIPNNLCEMIDLNYLDLSNNNISGEIPVCRKNNSVLQYIDLSNNQITGVLPASVGSLQYLTILQLDNNKLYGQIPSTLQQCKRLVFLSLARNKFSGTIPSWISKLQDLVVFQLRSNEFSAGIPPELGELSKLQVLDLAHNFIDGSIPSSVGNISGMKNSTQSFDSTAELVGGKYEVILHIDFNGQQAYTSTPLDFAKTIDISGNNLNGTIPEEIWQLQAVINLNLSNNYLIGEIPQAIGGMLSLESLDLSFNDLLGPIPQALSTLSLLHNLNLSYNNFSGKIPTGRQLDTINVPSIYFGNPELCGPPTDKNCSEDQASTSIYFADDDNGKEMLWFYVVVVLGFIVGFCSLWGVIIFQNDWRAAYFRMVDKLFDKMYVFNVLAFRRRD